LATVGSRSSSAESGEVIAGPLYGEEGILVADCDLRVGLHAERRFDVAGHYSREDILAPGRR
jgi:nitrilase